MSPIVLLLFLVSQVPGSAEPQLLGVLSPGRHPVGYRVLQLRDASRPMGPKHTADGQPRQDRGRPLHVHLWYPAAAPTGPALTLGDYAVASAAPAQESSAAVAEYRAFVGRLFPPALADPDWQRYTGTALQARRDAAAAPGRFPLIVGTFRPMSLTLTSEYLASHGYVVAFVQGPREEIDADGPVFEALQMTQGTRDMEFAIAAARELAVVDPVALGALGFSGSGLAQLPLAMRNREVDAVAQLDTGSFGPQGSSYRALAAYDPSVLRTPYFFAYGAATLAQPDLHQAELQKMRYAPRVVVFAGEPRLHHWDFATEGPAMMAALNRRPDARRGAGRVTAAVHRQLLTFFEAYVRKDRQALASITGHHMAPGPGAMIESQYLAPIEPAITRREFRRLLDENPARAAAAAREGLQRDPFAAVFGEEYLNLLGYELLNQRQGEKALEVLRLNVDAHPRSANAMDSLSEALELLGQPAAAVEWAEKALATLASDKTLPPDQRKPLEAGLRARIGRLKK